jgi:short-subunit dehydrogenase
MDDTFRGRRALVTGASSGIGAELARGLAERGADLVLVARRRERLEEVAQTCRLFGAKVEIATADLADPAARDALAATHGAVDVLVNNAGLGVFGPFAEADWARTARMLEVNVTALAHLSRLYAPAMAGRGFGRILLVGSTAAFQPVPLYAAYAASKSFVVAFGVALDEELRAQGVRVTTLCPGVTESEFHDVAGQRKSQFVRRSMMTSAEVARIGLAGLAKGRPVVVAGGMNAAMALGARLAPPSLTARLAHRMMKP